MRFASLLALVLACLVVGACGGDDPVPAQGDDGGGTPATGTVAAPEALGFPVVATRNTTRVGGADAPANAAGVALAAYPSRTADTRPRAVTLVDTANWAAAISAAQLAAAPVGAPVLLSEGAALPAATQAALADLRPAGVREIDTTQVVRVGATAPAEGYRTRDLVGTDVAGLARDVDALRTEIAGGEPTRDVVVASADQPAYAMPAAGWAAKSGDPVLWVRGSEVPAATLEAIRARDRARVFVLGPASVVPDAVVKRLERIRGATVTRIGAEDPVANAIAFARFSDSGFGWGVVDPGHGIVFASTGRPADAAAGALLSGTGSYGPLLLLTEANALPVAVQDFLLDIQPGYDDDPVRGVYNHGWLIGGEATVSVDVQARIDTLLQIEPVAGG